MTKKPPLIRCSMTTGGESFLGAFLSMEDVDVFLHHVHQQHTGLVKVLGWDRATYYVRPSSVSLFHMRDNGHRDPQFYDPGAS